MKVCKNGHLDLVKILVEMGQAEFGKRNKDNKTALDIAKEYNHKDVVIYILETMLEKQTEKLNSLKIII